MLRIIVLVLLLLLGLVRLRQDLYSFPQVDCLDLMSVCIDFTSMFRFQAPIDMIRRYAAIVFFWYLEVN